MQPHKIMTRKRKHVDDGSTDIDDDNFVDSPASSEPETESEADAGIMIEEVCLCALTVIRCRQKSIII